MLNWLWWTLSLSLLTAATGHLRFTPANRQEENSTYTGTPSPKNITNVLNYSAGFEPNVIDINDGFGDHESDAFSTTSVMLNKGVGVGGLTMFRHEMRRKLEDMQKMQERQNISNVRFRLYNTREFLRMKWVQDLPEEGLAIFVVDDPFHSSDKSIKGGSYLEDPRILAFGAENYVGDLHPKVVQLPIGLESNMMVGKRGHVVDLFLSIARSPVPYHERTHNLQSDAQLSVFSQPASGLGNDRQAMIDGVQKSAVDQWYEKRIPFNQHLEIAGKSRLSLCPEGNGVDCHRFYHNYAIGTRCVVKNGPMTPLHSQFPGTVVIDRWADVTEENVMKWVKEDPPERDMQLLNASYWINRVLRVAQQIRSNKSF